jgi:hypothetical protein
MRVEMHDRASASYPRPRGVVVPDLLMRAGCPVRAGLDADHQTQAATKTVKWVHGSFRRLPTEVLDTTIPDPSVILRTWSLSARTRGAVARLGTSEPGHPWRIRDLIGAKRLGPAALVDLLAAREEHEPSANASKLPPVIGALGTSRVASPVASRLDDLSRLIQARLPLSSEELSDLLVSSGLSTARLGLGDIARLFRDWQVSVPFRVVRRGGAAVLVAPTNLASAESLVTTASHLVFHWGLCTLNTVVGRIRSFSASAVEFGANAAARVLASIPRFLWLDEASGWFSFVGYSSRLRIAIRKVFAVADRVSYRDLSAGLAKRVKALSTAPRPAIEAYLSKVAGCEIDGDWVRPGAAVSPSLLAKSERAIVDVFRQRGGKMTQEALRRHAAAAGLKLASIRHFVRTSPLVLVRAGQLRLVGL